MSWSGDWKIQYNGDNYAKFRKLMQIVTPYFNMESGTLKDTIETMDKCMWNSAEKDIESIMEYLDDSEHILLTIDGETHPYKTEENRNEIELDNEQILFEKMNGQVLVQNKYPDLSRSKSVNTQWMNMLKAYLSSVKMVQNTFLGEVEATPKSYLEYVATLFNNDEEILPVIQKFMYKTFDTDKILELYRTEGIGKVLKKEPDNDRIFEIIELRKSFETLEGTKKILDEKDLKHVSLRSLSDEKTRLEEQLNHIDKSHITRED